MAATECIITPMKDEARTITMKVYRDTLRKLKAAAALRGELMVQMIDRLADEELRRAREADEPTKGPVDGPQK